MVIKIRAVSRYYCQLDLCDGRELGLVSASRKALFVGCPPIYIFVFSRAISASPPNIYFSFPDFYPHSESTTRQHMFSQKNAPLHDLDRPLRRSRQLPPYLAIDGQLHLALYTGSR